MIPVIREMREEDFPAVEELHRQDGYTYALPPLGSEKWVRRYVLEESNEIVGAGLGLLSAEAFLMLKRAHRYQMAKRFALIQREAVDSARRMGLSGLHAWLAPEAAERFGETLLRIGWSKPLWPAFERIIS